MATTTNGLVTPALSDANNPPADLLALANTIDTAYGKKVADLATLDATPGSFPGQRKYVESTDEVGVWDDTLNAWTGVTRTFTPSWTNVTLGTTGLVNTGEYIINNKRYSHTTLLTLGTGGSFGGIATLTLPASLNLAASALFAPVGRTFMQDGGASTARRDGGIYPATATTLQFLISDNPAGTTILNTTIPWTWTATDILNTQVVNAKLA